MPTPNQSYTYEPPNQTPGPVTPIPHDHILIGQAGSYGISADRMLFISATPNQIAFTPGSNRNAVGLLAGGNVSLNGNFNAVVAQSGQLYANDHQGDMGNAFAVGSGVSLASFLLQPTDQVFLAGVSQADIDAGFASLAVHPQAGYAAHLSLPRAGGSPLTLVLPDHHVTPPSVTQFHGA
jgi:hypothetical protein